MKKLLLIIIVLLLFTLSSCKEEEDPIAKLIKEKQEFLNTFHYDYYTNNERLLNGEIKNMKNVDDWFNSQEVKQPTFVLYDLTIEEMNDSKLEYIKNYIASDKSFSIIFFANKDYSSISDLLDVDNRFGKEHYSNLSSFAISFGNFDGAGGNITVGIVGQENIYDNKPFFDMKVLEQLQDKVTAYNATID